MPQIRLASSTALLALCGACATGEHSDVLPSEPPDIASSRIIVSPAPSDSSGSSELSSSLLALLALSSDASVSHPTGDPPEGWVAEPTELAPDYPQSASSCDLVTFPFPAVVKPYLHPTAACQQRDWGNSGIVRQQGRDLHVTSLKACGGGPGDITEIRLCALACERTAVGRDQRRLNLDRRILA